jgi:hypothetical protein
MCWCEDDQQHRNDYPYNISDFFFGFLLMLVVASSIVADGAFCRRLARDEPPPNGSLTPQLVATVEKASTLSFWILAE